MQAAVTAEQSRRQSPRPQWRNGRLAAGRPQMPSDDTLVLRLAVAAQQAGADNADLRTLRLLKHRLEPAIRGRFRVVVEEEQVIAAGAGSAEVDRAREVEPVALVRNERRHNGLELVRKRLMGGGIDDDDLAGGVFRM